MRKVTCFVCFFCCAVYATAHPHMWFDCEFEVVFNQGVLQGVYVNWTFDKFFSSDIIAGYDANHDGVFNYAETTDVFQNAFTYTKDYKYFTFIRTGKERKSPVYVDRSKFSATQKNGVLSYRFFVDLSAYKDLHELYIACYDYTFFCDIGYTKQCVSFTGTTNSPKYSIFENKSYPIYYNPFGAMDDMRIYSKWAPGLNTYYPREVKITF